MKIIKLSQYHNEISKIVELYNCLDYNQSKNIKVIETLFKKLKEFKNKNILVSILYDNLKDIVNSSFEVSDCDDLKMLPHETYNSPNYGIFSFQLGIVQYNDLDETERYYEVKGAIEFNTSQFTQIMEKMKSDEEAKDYINVYKENIELPKLEYYNINSIQEFQYVQPDLSKNPTYQKVINPTHPNNIEISLIQKCISDYIYISKIKHNRSGKII